jgi:spermidine synthase
MRLWWSKIYETASTVSGKITVLDNGHERKLIIGSATQSRTRPGREDSVWSALIPDHEVRSALILGLGAGTVARLLRERWPEVRIAGYELDPAVVRVATSFFNLDPQISVHIADARQAFTGSEKFDLVVVDIYLGTEFPEFAKGKEFINEVMMLLLPGGQASFNRIEMPQDHADVEQFEKNIKSIFPKVWKKKVGYNTIIWGQNK